VGQNDSPISLGVPFSPIVFQAEAFGELIASYYDEIPDLGAPK
jgi:hypothetical protein